MVSVTTTLPKEGPIAEGDLRAWLNLVGAGRKAAQRARIEQAALLALELNDGLPEGAGDLHTALSTAEILAEMDLDLDTLVASILLDAPRHPEMTPERLQQQFDAGVARMIRDLAQIDALTGREDAHRSDARHQENLRRMLLSISEDIRVLLIVLARRLHLMRQAKRWSRAEQQAMGRETRDIYAPMANRLGIWQLKWELEDLSLRYLAPDEYMEIAQDLDGRRTDRERYIDQVMQTLRNKFDQAQIQGDIAGRPKHIYSIWKKMKRKGVGLDQIFDLRAVRVLVHSIADCYAALGVVHGSWRHIPGEFDDYIATPKPNGYRSIHTAVIGPEDKTLEVQIRTSDMHEHAELGVAAHWRYKEAGKQDSDFERRVSLMRNWLANKDSEEYQANEETPEGEFEIDRVYVLTPQGKVIELPTGATAVDFAYAIHSAVGHRCRGARIDGRIAPLTQALKSGQMVDIITAKEGGPSRDWLNPHTGYLHSTRARNRVRNWFKQQDYERHLALGRNLLDKELGRQDRERPDLEQAARKYNLQSENDLLAAIGRGDASAAHLAGLGEPRQTAEPTAEDAEAQLLQARKHRHRPKRSGASGIVVEGIEDLLTHTAKCCKPVPGEEIAGFITHGRGISIHRADCPQITGLDAEGEARLVEAHWGENPSGQPFEAEIRVVASDRKGLLRDISAAFTAEEVDVLGVNTRSDRSSDLASLFFTVEVNRLQHLERLLIRLENLPDVLQARRK